MSTKAYEFKYQGSVTPAATQFLQCNPIKIDFAGTMELDETDGSNAPTIQKQFQAQMDQFVKNQLQGLNMWLKEKNTLIAGLKTDYDKLKAIGPLTKAQSGQYQKRLDDLKSLGTQIQNLPKDWTQIVSDWAENLPKQQGLRAMKIALQKARVARFNQKVFRVTTGQVVVGGLIVSALVLSIVTTIVSAGTTAPVFVALGGIGILFSGLAAFVQITKMVVDNINQEKRVLENARKDVDAVLAAFNGVKGKGSALAKHATELSNLIKVREDGIKKMTFEVTKYDGLCKKYYEDLRQLYKNPMASQNAIDSKRKEIDEVKAALDNVKEKKAKLETSNEEAGKLLDSLKALGVSLDKITGEAPNTIENALTNHVNNLNNWVSYLNAAGSTFSGISGMHK